MTVTSSEAVRVRLSLLQNQLARGHYRSLSAAASAVRDAMNLLESQDNEIQDLKFQLQRRAEVRRVELKLNVLLAQAHADTVARMEARIRQLEGRPPPALRRGPVDRLPGDLI